MGKTTYQLVQDFSHQQYHPPYHLYTFTLVLLHVQMVRRADHLGLPKVIGLETTLESLGPPTVLHSLLI